MRRRSALAVAILLVAGTVSADEAALRGQVTAAIDAQLEVARRTKVTVDLKRDELRAARARRTRSAYKLLRAGAAPSWVEPDERMATARRRAAARWLLARDRREEALLVDEAALVDAAVSRLTADRAAADAAPLPAFDLQRPVAGRVARAYGPFEHERSKATLTRRGVDFEVAEAAEVRPVADGVVLYAGAIRGLEHGLVIDHGSYVSVLGKLAPTSLHIGDPVSREDVVGQPARRRVYLEVRAKIGPGGVPVDPMQLLAP